MNLRFLLGADIRPGELDVGTGDVEISEVHVVPPILIVVQVQDDISVENLVNTVVIIFLIPRGVIGVVPLLFLTPSGDYEAEQEQRGQIENGD